MKVTVTGASGHVGSTLCRALLEKGYQVRALEHHDTRGLDGLDVERVKGDILDKESLKTLIDDTRIVFHLAARISVSSKDNKDLFSINVEGTKNLIEVSKNQGVKRLIHFSSIHALDHFPLNEEMDEDRPRVESSPMLYEVTKSKGDKLVMDACRANGLEAIIFNPTAIFGPYDFKPSLLGQALINIYKNAIPGLVNGGYDFVDVRDVCQAAIAAIDKGRPGDRYILSGRWASLPELSSLVNKVTGKPTPKNVVPDWLARLGIPFLQAYAAIKREYPLYTRETLEILKTGNSHISNEKARRELGFSPRDLEESLKDTYHWYATNGYL